MEYKENSVLYSEGREIAIKLNKQTFDEQSWYVCQQQQAVTRMYSSFSI